MKNQSNPPEQRFRSVFDLPSDFFDSASLLSNSTTSATANRSSSSSPWEDSLVTSKTSINDGEDENRKNKDEEEQEKGKKFSRWSCNTCKVDFESLEDQRSHFKSDIHRFNVKLSIGGRNTIKEEEFDESISESLFKDYDISSISGSEDEAERASSNASVLGKAEERVKHKFFFRLKSGNTVSLCRCLLLDESEDLSSDGHKLTLKDSSGCNSCLAEDELLKRLKCLTNEPRDKTRLRIVLLASGGHFAGCVFDGNSLIAHKTFHRYVVRAKAGKKQSAKDGTGKASKSAGASLRRHNEMALKKDIQELLAAWKLYFDASTCVFVHAPSNNRQLLFDGEKPYFSHQNSVVRHVPLTVRRPTLKEAKRIYNHQTLLVHEVEEEVSQENGQYLLSCVNAVGESNQDLDKEQVQDHSESKDTPEASSDLKSFNLLPISSESDVIGTTISPNQVTPLHEAARAGDAQLTLELLEQGLDPCVKDPRGRTPYMLATEKEVRNTFRRFMALNLDKWDWHAANVPSALTKEMEDSQAEKQAEKDAKRKAKTKEMKKLRRAKEKAQAKAVIPQNSPKAPHGEGAVQVSVLQGKKQFNGGATMSKEEELKRAQAEEREKRAAAAERRIAALNANANSNANTAGTTSAASATTNLVSKSGESDIKCSCCMASLAGKVPFHRYHYKYCSTSCMHVHREMLEDG